MSAAAAAALVCVVSGAGAAHLLAEPAAVPAWCAHAFAATLQHASKATNNHSFRPLHGRVLLLLLLHRYAARNGVACCEELLLSPWLLLQQHLLHMACMLLLIPGSSAH